MKSKNRPKEGSSEKENRKIALEDFVILEISYSFDLSSVQKIHFFHQNKMLYYKIT
jgi:hypothetical protein